MLGGEFRHALDAKGRVSVPFRFRNEMGDVVVVSKGIGEKCLYIFPMSEWKKIEDKISGLPISDARAREVTRFFAGGSSEIEIDKQGRIMLPQYLRDYACLGKDVVIIGAVNRAEIWDTAVWEAQLGSNGEYYANIEEDMKELGI
ncbi:MAG: division/cell wall cluster transcriptional repressor MraZ [Eubacteriaceae bacterium]|nr:division/cell wall cluster transcriptional repressor MraZ [Eubacteriaceae bacterium]MCR4893638.1 division/cell wall cluster transcriptional repressor MraZ [Eubacteriales bacterium]